jgi:lysophospholipase L1-like esterase
LPWQKSSLLNGRWTSQRSELMAGSAQLLGMKLILGPLLLVQGWWVRKRTPVLPEPVKQTSGQRGSGPMLRLLVVGDSSAAGVGAESADDSLLGQLVEVLSQRHTVHFNMLAKTGRTTRDMLDSLAAAQAEPFDVVVSALGVNDVTSQVPVTRWGAQQQQLIHHLKDRFSTRLIILSGLPPVRDFPALPWPLNAYLGSCADLLNTRLQQLCHDQPGVCFHSLRDDYPDTATAAVDGFHPGPVVYHHWARFIADIIDQSDWQFD